MKIVALMTILIRFNDDTWKWLTVLGHPVLHMHPFAICNFYLKNQPCICFACADINIGNNLDNYFIH